METPAPSNTWRSAERQATLLLELRSHFMGPLDLGIYLAQASQEAGLYAHGHRDGQIAIICSGVRGTWSGGASRARPETEQQGGSVAPAGPPTRAKDAAVQVGRISSALPRHACRRPQHVQCSTPSDLPPHAAPLPSRGDAAMARSDDGRLTVVRLENRRTSVELP